MRPSPVAVRARRGPNRWLAGLALCAAGLAACGEPIVAHTPEQLYALAREQSAAGNYRAAADTLARVSNEAPGSETGRRAQALRVALLGGMARAYREIGEAFLTGSKQPAAGGEATRLRAAGIDALGRARDRSLEMADAVDRLLNQQAAGPWRLQLPPPPGPEIQAAALDTLRRGRWATESELAAAERELVQRELARYAAQLAGGRAGGGEVEVPPEVFYLGAAQELVRASRMYAREALDEPRMIRFYHERAAAAAERARQLAATRGNDAARGEAERLLAECRQVLGRH